MIYREQHQAGDLPRLRGDRLCVESIERAFVRTDISAYRNE